MTAFDPASFRDPSGRLFRHAGAIYRTCSPEALATFTRARDVGLLDALISTDLLVPSTLVESAAEGLSSSEVGAQVIRQPELPLVSYSYEWSFSMLRDAALVTLRALEACLDKGFVLKDATSFNVLFEGTFPRLVDVHSLEVRQEGALWAGYTQFCRAFLFPLFLLSYKGLDPRPPAARRPRRNSGRRSEPRLRVARHVQARRARQRVDAAAARAALCRAGRRRQQGERSRQLPSVGPARSSVEAEARDRGADAAVG